MRSPCTKPSQIATKSKRRTTYSLGIQGDRNPHIRRKNRVAIHYGRDSRRRERPVCLDQNRLIRASPLAHIPHPDIANFGFLINLCAANARTIDRPDGMTYSSIRLGL
jgi:hypothetical protein